MVGLSLIDYFQALAIADPLPEEQSLERLRQVLQNTFQTSRQTNVLQAFVTQAIQRLKPEKVALQHPLG